MRRSLRRILAEATEHLPFRRTKTSPGSHTHSARWKRAATKRWSRNRRMRRSLRRILAEATEHLPFRRTYFYFTPNL